MLLLLLQTPTGEVKIWLTWSSKFGDSLGSEQANNLSFKISKGAGDIAQQHSTRLASVRS